MPNYQHNKVKTACDIVRRIENWPTAIGMRMQRQKPGLRLLRFRNGTNVICRGGTRDWDVVHELFFAGSYDQALRFLGSCAGEPVVLDLGGNIGLFSLLASHAHRAARIHAYEPGPPNSRLFEMNMLANPEVAGRIELHKEAVGGQDRRMCWSFNEANPGGSSLFGGTGTQYEVQIRAFADIILRIDRPIALAKIDIEGAEFELLEHTPPEVWRQIQAISLELHDDPEQKSSRDQFLQRMAGLGYSIAEEKVCSYFLHRSA